MNRRGWLFRMLGGVAALIVPARKAVAGQEHEVILRYLGKEFRYSGCTIIQVRRVRDSEGRSEVTITLRSREVAHKGLGSE